jgi:uncharacterized protein with ParB-like and HNH nuclease domain
LKSIKEIFSGAIYRVPDYQRGYSWENSQLEDFWQDLMNLQPDRIHYTGMICLEEVSKTEYQKWDEDLWLIEGKGDKPYFIVDGQQRLTTIIILIWVIANKLEDSEQLNYEGKSGIMNKYINIRNDQKNLMSYLFGYHKDNPSYNFLKREIFEDPTYIIRGALEETLYTNNLKNAKEFFFEKLKKLERTEIENTYKKITQNLKFDYKILEKELDIFVVFETMNNRGKALTNLEKLKNRLIYLSTLIEGNDEQRLELRDKINQSWQTVYSYLGKNKDKPLDDDLFLQHHWIMYSRYDRREAEFYAIDLFDRNFTAYNALTKKINYNSILDYITSISESVRLWFVIWNPTHTHTKDLMPDKEVLVWLEKLNRLEFRMFASVLLASFVNNTPFNHLINLLKSIEAYLFLIFYVSNRRSNTGSYHFNALANDVYKSKVTMDDIIKDIKYWIYGDEGFGGYGGYFEIDNFYTQIKDLFAINEKSGFYDWKRIKYFLYEYELSLSKEVVKVEWNDTSIIKLYDINNKICNYQSFEGYKKSERHFLTGSLGNLVMIDRKTARKIEDKCFDESKIFLQLSSFSGEEVGINIEWTPQVIQNRGIQMLIFLEKRWGVSLKDYDFKRKLLFLDFLN